MKNEISVVAAALTSDTALELNYREYTGPAIAFEDCMDDLIANIFYKRAKLPDSVEL